MKLILIALAFVGMSAAPSSLLAQSPSPFGASSSVAGWTGPYSGVTYGQSDVKRTTTETVTEVIPGEEIVICLGTRCRGTGEFEPDTILTSTETVTTIAQKEETGAFAGYRYDAGRFVAGLEAATDGGLDSLKLQGGVDLGPVLAFVSAGYGNFVGSDGDIYGLGADLRVGLNTMMGLEYAEGHFGDAEISQTTLRIGFLF